MSEIKYKRVLLKLSGEMLGGQEKRGIDISVLDEISNQIKRMLEAKSRNGNCNRCRKLLER